MSSDFILRFALSSNQAELSFYARLPVESIEISFDQLGIICEVGQEVASYTKRIEWRGVSQMREQLGGDVLAPHVFATFEQFQNEGARIIAEKIRNFFAGGS